MAGFKYNVGMPDSLILQQKNKVRELYLTG